MRVWSPEQEQVITVHLTTAALTLICLALAWFTVTSCFPYHFKLKRNLIRSREHQDSD